MTAEASTIELLKIATTPLAFCNDNENGGVLRRYQHQVLHSIDKFSKRQA